MTPASRADLPPDAARPLPLSQRLAQVVAEPGADRLTFTDLAERLGARAWGGLLLIFAVINTLPLPPGTSTFFAIPMLIVSAQMLAGRKSPWFPGRIDRRGVTKNELRRLIGKLEWFEVRVERIFKPRMPRLTGAFAARTIGLVCFLLALLAAIPIPLFHIAPAAAIALFGLSLIYRDGMLVVAASIGAVASILVNVLLIGSGVMALTYLAAKFGL